jgi:RimJ/RimL family protein N-acetyltransferase
MTIIPTLETERLILRPHRASDFEPFAAMWADPIVARYVGGVTSNREASWSKLMRMMGVWQALGFGFFAIEEKGTGTYVGGAGFHEMRRDMTPSIEGTLEAGWGLAPEAHGKGYATEAMRAAIAWAEAQDFGMPMTCIIDEANTPSKRVAEKLGFCDPEVGCYLGHSILVYRRPL